MNWIAFGSEVSGIIEQAHKDSRKRVDIQLNGICVRMWLHGRFLEDLRTGRKSALRRSKPTIGTFTVPAVNDDQCENPEERAMKKKLMGGGTYTRAEFMRMMEKDGAVLVVKKEWAAKTATPPLLGEDKLAEEYVLKSQGELELDVLK